MNQMTLGKCIANARKKKTWTQEEVANKCQISTRTLQRIETDKVNPRAYTLNCLIDVLEIPKEEIDMINGSFHENRSILEQFRNTIEKIFSRENVYTTAWIATLITLVLVIPDIIFDHIIEDSFYDPILVFWYRVFNIFIIFPLVLSTRGFIFLGSHYKNDLLLISSWFLIFLDIMDRLASVVFVYEQSETIEGIVGVTFLLLIGCGLIVFGVGLKRLKKIPIPYAKPAGILNIIIGILFVLVIPVLMGVILLIPLALLEVMLLYHVSKVLKA